MILLDTDVCVALIRGNDAAEQRRLGCADATAIAAMTVGELYYGAEKSMNPADSRRAVDRFIGSVVVIHTTMHILQIFGRIKADLERTGLRLPDADLLIAATSLSCGGVLVTGNIAHFCRIPGLTIENWLRPE